MNILSSEKNPNTGENEVFVKISNSEIKWLKSIVAKCLEDKIGFDGDDYEQLKIGDNIFNGLLECKNILNPAY